MFDRFESKKIISPSALSDSEEMPLGCSVRLS